MNLDELDRLHAAATAGERLDHGDDSVRWDDPMACGYCTGPEQAEADASTVVALHNAWPEVSARLRAAEAEVERLRVALREAANDMDSECEGWGAKARAALGEP